MKRLISVAVGFLAIVLVAALALPERLKPNLIASDDERFCRACEAVLFQRLRSPSTYKRIECTPVTVKAATLDEYLGWNWPDKEKEFRAVASNNADIQKNHDYIVQIFKEGKDGIARTVIEYDAANGFGTPIRGRSVCEKILHSSLKLNDSSELGLRVDGDTQIEWAMKGIK